MKAGAAAVGGLLSEMAENWYGYGRWDAPFWFLGPQPGGDDPLAAARVRVRLGGDELLDCQKHHESMAGAMRFFGPPPIALQPTWNKLMLLMFAFKSQETTPEERREYQATLFGSERGETCVIELCSVASQQMALDGQYCTEYLRNRRIEHIRRRIEENKPAFVVAYSKNPVFVRSIQQLVRDFDFRDGVRQVGSTLVLLTAHPVAFGYSNGDWIERGRMLRQMCEAGGLWEGANSGA